MRRPLIPVALIMAAGVVFGRCVDVRGQIFYLCAILIPAAYLIGSRLLEKRLPPYLFVAAALALYGAVYSSHAEYDEIPEGHILHYASRESLDVEGVVVLMPERKADKFSMHFRAEKIYLAAGAFIPVKGKILLSVPLDEMGLRYGDRLRFSTRIRRIVPFGNPGAFRVDRYYRYRGVEAMASVNSRSDLKIVGRGAGWAFWRITGSIRSALRARLDAQLISPQREIVAALLIGESGSVPKPIRNIFRDAGVAHLLAISGLHMGVIASAVFVIVFFMLRRFPRLLLATNAMKLSAAISLLPTAAFCLLAGATFSAVRASVMIGVLLFAIITDRHRDVLSAVALAALLIMIARPVSLFDVGFQLSFAAVTAIILAVPRCIAWRRTKRAEDPISEAFPTMKMKATDWLIVAAATPLAAGIATAPISAWHFNGLSLFGLISNVFLVPLYSMFIIPASILGAFLMPLSIGLSQIVLDADVYAINTGFHLAQLIAAIPGSYVRVGTPSFLEIAAVYGLIFSVLHWKRRIAARAASAVCVLILIVAPAAYRIADWTNNDLRFTLIDVGQGLSQLIEIPGGEKILVDGGGFAGSSFDIGENALAPFLWKKRIKSIDIIVNTHPHPDHYLGLDFIVEHFGVREMWISGQKKHAPAQYKEIIAKAKGKSIVVKVLDDETEERAIGSAVLEVLWPPKTAYDNDSFTLNDASIVLRLGFGEKTFLLSADIEEKAEKALSEQTDLSADVLVAGHHGGKTSSTPEFVKAAHPRYALIPVGRQNRYGHPDEKVLARLRSSRAMIYRTDEDGQVKCTTDGVDLKCEPFWKEKHQ